MTKKSAGLLPFRIREESLEVFLVHPGGPFWARKDLGAWSIAKGEYSDDEDPLAAARREFREETGFAADDEVIPLGEIAQRGGKLVTAWAVRGDFDPLQVKSNTFSMEWPPRSGKQHEFPEIDRAEWFSLDEGRTRILPAQAPFLARLAEHCTAG